jgi:hypothetical protein
VLLAREQELRIRREPERRFRELKELAIRSTDRS